MKNYVVICLLSFMVSGCVTTPEPSMEHVVDYALNRAVEQYKHMYAVMDSIPEGLKPQTLISGRAVFIPELFGTYMNIPETSN